MTNLTLKASQTSAVEELAGQIDQLLVAKEGLSHEIAQLEQQVLQVVTAQREAELNQQKEKTIRTEEERLQATVDRIAELKASNESDDQLLEDKNKELDRVKSQLVNLNQQKDQQV